MHQAELFKTLPLPTTEQNAPIRDRSRTQQATKQDKSFSRSLKIEADGDPWKGKVKPKIRLKGRWLAFAGFKPGERTQVKFIAPGIIELRSTTEAASA